MNQKATGKGKSKGKGKCHPTICHEGTEGKQRYSSTFFLIPLLARVVVNFTPLSFYPREIYMAPNVQDAGWAL
jgi:hypothetical protein